MKRIFFLIFIMISFTFHPVHADILSEQKQMDADIKTELESKSYGFDDPLVLINPYKIAPLCALIAFKTEKPSRISIHIAGKDDDTSITHTFAPYTLKHLIPIYGLYEGDNTVTLSSETKTGEKQTKTLTLTTEKTPLKTTVEILRAEPEKMHPGFTFATPGVIVNPGNFLFAFDKNGDIRFVLNDPIMGKMSPLHVLKNNHLIISSEEYDPKYTVAYHSLYEIDFLGKIHNRIKVEDDIQHDMIELPNGNYLALVNASSKDKFIADYIVELNRENEILDRFDMQEILKLDNPRIPTLVEHYLYKDNYSREKMDFMHLNSLAYDPEDDSILMTARFYHCIIKIDRKTKEIKWILANPLNPWLTPYLKEKLLHPLDASFDYVYGAHAVKAHGKKCYSVLDNGLYRDIYDKGFNQPIDSYNPSYSWSRGVEFEINEKNKTVRTIWQFKRGPELYTHYLGDIDKFSDTHYLMNFGAVIADKDETIRTVETALAPAKQTVPSFAKIIEVKDGAVIFEAQTGGQTNTTVYRVERIMPYLTSSEYKLK